MINLILWQLQGKQAKPWFSHPDSLSLMQDHASFSYQFSHGILHLSAERYRVYKIRTSPNSKIDIVCCVPLQLCVCVWLYMWAHTCTLLMTDDFLPLGLADKIQTEADINGRRMQPLWTFHKWIFDLAHTPRPCNCNSACCPGDGQDCSSINTPWLCSSPSSPICETKNTFIVNLDWKSTPHRKPQTILMTSWK